MTKPAKKAWRGRAVYAKRATHSAFGKEIRFVTVYQDDHFRIRVEKVNGGTWYVLYQRTLYERCGHLRARDWEEVDDGKFFDLEEARKRIVSLRPGVAA